ncbi:MAG: hypothetical protein K8F36_03830 [Melioribacteraceae bacterium]|nr:hypothetical protein [Melioribacteraceae bacterium]
MKTKKNKSFNLTTVRQATFSSFNGTSQSDLFGKSPKYLATFLFRQLKQTAILQ